MQQINFFLCKLQICIFNARICWTKATIGFEISPPSPNTLKKQTEQYLLELLYAIQR